MSPTDPFNWVPSRILNNTVVLEFVDERLERLWRWFASWISHDEKHSLPIAIPIGYHYRGRALHSMYLLAHA